jgi:threonine synthase
VAGVREFWNKYQLLLEPHGAVAWEGFLDWTAAEPLGDSPAVIVETANPAKFPDEVEKVVGWPPDVPEKMLSALKLPEDYDRMGADYDQFKASLLKAHA